jgi:sterol desaturase/sphingolipid hydroxylase (fatty acid hydroxylase superfamily)
MQNIINYFSHIPSSHRAALLVCGIAFFWLVETAFPLFHFSYKKWRHVGINIFFTITTILVNFSLAVILLKTTTWAQTNQFGLLFLLPNLNIWLYTLLGLMLLDLIGAYLAHFVQHKVRWLWMFHLIHHTDRHLDTTSGNRHHPGESVVRFFFTAVAMVVLGAPIWLFMLYQSCSIVFTQFTHANIQLPQWADKILSWLIVTPNMHHVHHHNIQPYTDCNYANIFALWDRLFGTYKYLHPTQITYGIDTYMAENETDNLQSLLAIPFKEYRPPVGAKFEKKLAQ